LAIIKIYGTLIHIVFDDIGDNAMGKLRKIPVQIYLEPEQAKSSVFCRKKAVSQRPP